MRLRHRLEDLPVGVRAAPRAERSHGALQPALAVDRDAFLLRERRGREHHVGTPGGGGEEQVAHDHELGARQRRPRPACDPARFAASDRPTIHSALIRPSAAAARISGARARGPCGSDAPHEDS